MSTPELVQGDCLEVMRELPAGLATALVSDPPYGLEFMGKEWDGATPALETWREALRVLRPGAHALVFGGTRTFHRLACALEDAGFEIRDCLSWIYGQGFPKSLDVSKAIDRAAGVEREVERVERSRFTRVDSIALNVAEYGDSRPVDEGGYQLKVHTKPATDAAKEWSGYGTALKPAWEPIILARKPLSGTVEANCREHGTGALNVNGCRIAVASGDYDHDGFPPRGPLRFAPGEGSPANQSPPNELGRWPANVILDEEAAAMLDAQSGERPGASSNSRKAGSGYGGGCGPIELAPGFGDTGGASRFFYCPKASDRDILPAESLPLFGEEHAAVVNTHPTVKPLELMRWLVRLVRGPGENLILDPFAGSGTTGVAAKLEGVPFLLIEREAAYVELARQRLERAR